MKMKKEEDEEKDEFQGCKCRAYGMNGVGKQTNSSHDSKRHSIIKKMDDGKGIGRRVNQNSHHPEEARKRLTLLGLLRYQPLSSCAHS